MFTSKQQAYLEGRKSGLEFTVYDLGFAKTLDLLCELHQEMRREPGWYKLDSNDNGHLVARDLRGIEAVDLEKTLASLRALVADLEQCRAAEQKHETLFRAVSRA